MSPFKVLALTTLLVVSTFAQTEWKEFTSPEGNFRVVSPRLPNNKPTPGGTYTSSVSLPAPSPTGLLTKTTYRTRIGKARSTASVMPL
jgi:hypothetical protein